MRDRVRLLAEHGADLRAPFKSAEDTLVMCVSACDGRTPAEVAAICGCWAVLDWLVEHGWAEHFGQRAMADYLRPLTPQE